MRTMPLKMLRILFTVAVSFALPAFAGPSLSPTEQKIVEYVDAHDAEAVALLEKLVNINSGTMNFEGVRKVGAALRAEFDSLGFETRWVEGVEFERAGHLMAERTGKGPRLLLIGHLDTVFELDSPFQKFELVDESSATGPGAADMKGGDVILLQAIKALEAVGVLEEMSLTVVITGDEEKCGRPVSLARQALTEAADRSDFAIAFENGDNDPATAVVARRGSTRWTLEVTAKTAHSSQIFQEEVGVGAIYEAARILNEFYERLSGEKNLTFNPGTILGGTSVEFDEATARGTAFGKNNVIAERTTVSGDLRTLSAEQLESAKKRMRQVVAEHHPGARAEITFSDSYPPLAPSEGNQRLLEHLSSVSEDLGLGPMTAVDPRKAGAADVSFAAGRVSMALDGLGLTGGGDHTVQEWVDLRALPMQTKRAALLFLRLTHPAGKQ